jgi:hypothetical protein
MDLSKKLCFCVAWFLWFGVGSRGGGGGLVNIHETLCPIKANFLSSWATVSFSRTTPRNLLSFLLFRLRRLATSLCIMHTGALVFCSVVTYAVREKPIMIFTSCSRPKVRRNKKRKWCPAVRLLVLIFARIVSIGVGICVLQKQLGVYCYSSNEFDVKPVVLSYELRWVERYAKPCRHIADNVYILYKI